MANKTEKIAFMVEMEIVLPDDQTVVYEKEKNAIAHRIFNYLTEIGTTSDDYDGHLKGELVDGQWKYALSVVDVPTNLEVVVNVHDGVITGARSNYKHISVDIFDEDNKFAEGLTQDEINEQWDKLSRTDYPFGIL